MADSHRYKRKTMKERESTHDLIRKHLQGEDLNADERRSFELWLQENEAAYDRYKKIWTQATRLTLHDEVNEDAQWDEFKVKRDRRISLGWYAAAAVVALLVAVGLYLFIPDDTIVLSNHTKEHTAFFVLADSSKVWLNKNTRLEIGSDFNEEYREVWLYGEGFFEIAHNEDKPFIVRNEFSIIQVLGTTFNALSTDSINKVCLLEGSVSFTDTPGQEVILVPGEQGTSRPHQPIVKASIADQNFLAWKTGVLKFNDQPMTYVKRVMESYYETTFVFSNQHISECNVTITFDNLMLEEALNELGFLLDLEYRIDRDRVLLSGAGCN